ncbi:Patatin-like phospholipase [uncultured archaeon]|nr:Patatin-like phospholipase [uncultured archaeon]
MVKKEKNRIRVAIACQGGGSHTAFTAGALKRILKEKTDKYEIVALSGTSGGAICALLTWYGLLSNDRNKAAQLLDSFWKEISASSYPDMLMNEWFVGSSRLQGTAPVLDISPYYYPPLAQERLKDILERLVKFDMIEGMIKKTSPDLLVGAVDVRSGDFKVFKNSEISVASILASAAIPTFLRAVHVNGNIYWDGLFSQNPPVRNFVDGVASKPDEIWVIQINPQNRKNEPISVRDIMDRRNELSGNLSLYQELGFIEKVNTWVKAGYLPAGKYKHIDVRWIQMLNEELDTASKVDRDPSFIQYMMKYGEEQAGKFLAQSG